MSKETTGPEVMVIELTDRRESSWVLEGTENTGQPVRLSAPADKTIKATSAVRVPNKTGGGYTLRKIRYIQGCDTIFFDEQEKRGFKPNPAVDKSDLTIKNGKRFIIRNGGDIALFDYFRNYEGNASNDNRPASAVAVYEEIKASVSAEKNISTFDDEMEAKDYLRELKISDKVKGVTYKEREIDFLINLFGLPFMDSYAEKFEALIGIATKAPTLFNESIANTKAGMISEVNQGRQLGVISFDASKAMLNNGNKILLLFKETKVDDQINELAVHFLSSKGEQDYKQFYIELDAAKKRSLSIEK